jgi:hypothetical protein
MSEFWFKVLFVLGFLVCVGAIAAPMVYYDHRDTAANKHLLDDYINKNHLDVVDVECYQAYCSVMIRNNDRSVSHLYCKNFSQGFDCIND